MIITIDRNRNVGEGERQYPIITIDTRTCNYPYAIREALEQALLLDGYTQNAINEIMNRVTDFCKPEEPQI